MTEIALNHVDEISFSCDNYHAEAQISEVNGYYIVVVSLDNGAEFYSKVFDNKKDAQNEAIQAVQIL